MRWVLGVCLMMVISQAGTIQAAPESGPKLRSARELGKVRWWRDYAGAKAEAKKTKKPLLILFDEVPG